MVAAVARSGLEDGATTGVGRCIEAAGFRGIPWTGTHSGRFAATAVPPRYSTTSFDDADHSTRRAKAPPSARTFSSDASVGAKPVKTPTRATSMPATSPVPSYEPGRVTQAVISIASASEASKNAGGAEAAEAAESSESDSDRDWDPQKERRSKRRRFFAAASPTTARAPPPAPYAPGPGYCRWWIPLCVTYNPLHSLHRPPPPPPSASAPQVPDAGTAPTPAMC